MKKIFALLLIGVLLFSGCLGQPQFAVGAGPVGPQNARSDLINYVTFNASTGIGAASAVINLTNPEAGRTYYVSYFSASANDTMSLALQKCTLINNYSIVNCSAAWKTIEVFTVAASATPYVVDLTNNPIKIANGSAFRVAAVSATTGPTYINFIYQNISGT